MAKLDTYRTYVQQLMKEYSRHKYANREIERLTIFDLENDHYLIFDTGWNDDERIHGCAIHVDIKDNKIWIQDDRTEFGIAQKLVDMGVPKEDIVLGFHAPYKRPYTGFAVN